MNIVRRIAKELEIKEYQVENTIKLIDEGNTIPFIARYRKEAHGSLDDTTLRELEKKLNYLRSLESKKEEVKNLLEKQGVLDEKLIQEIEKADTLSEIEDIYRPYRPKRRTRATIAKEKGLNPLEEAIYNQTKFGMPLEEYIQKYIDDNKDTVTVESLEEAINGISDIIAEFVSDDAEIRKRVRGHFILNSQIVSKATDPEAESVYSNYYDYAESTIKIADHRILAVNRGEKEGFLKVTIQVSKENVLRLINNYVIKNDCQYRDFLEKAIEDSYTRLIEPSIEREIRNSLTERAVEGAIKNFSKNLKQLLMQRPLKGKVVMGIDPAYRTGCKFAVCDDTGKVLDTGVIYPTPPHNKVEEAAKILKAAIEKHDVDVIAIGNGTASGETEMFAASLHMDLKRNIGYIVVNEAGASVYSASELAAEEFPDFDVALRSAVSIARRLQDPLTELVKIDPKAIGVGQYQHDMPTNLLDSALKGVVEDSVNTVGVDLNTASFSILSYVSGINTSVAREIVKYREENGKFKNRKELLKVPKLGAKTFEMCAGFLRIPESDDFLDNTAVHPESYEPARKLLEMCGIESTKDLKLVEERARKLGIEKIAKAIEVGVPTLVDIIEEIKKPGRDIRDTLPSPIVRTELLTLENLKEGMILTGTVRNVIDFGAFVDIGVHQDGLVHISEICDKYIKHPSEVLSVGDIIKVKVISVDAGRKRISLSMKNIPQ
ncbi:MAG: RNA-binding transcriptional accessory protein [Clostridiaceae bacterium]|nr:RNA-binding transcriptional accessory protein [Clostridiaceae bacterium]